MGGSQAEGVWPEPEGGASRRGASASLTGTEVGFAEDNWTPRGSVRHDGEAPFDDQEELRVVS